ncbi:MAG TPA: polysaccharide deacetylase family protein [Rhodanobacteraceae bacterium]|nr:polysaccharide deacetylase family protein [Rhodanobacteraceae bacterium]
MSPHAIYRSLAIPVRWASHWSGTALRRAQAIRKPRILMYHIVGDGEVSTRQFEWQVKFLREQFEPIGLAELADRIQAGSVTGRETVVTFDDGVRNHFTVAWPLLRAYRVPATFFVCPGLTESGEWLWRTELRMRLRLLNDAERAEAARDAGCPVQAVEPVMEWTKRLAMQDRLVFQRDIEKRTRGFSASREDTDRHAPLTWEQLRQMDANLITIGSHTNTHPMLPMLDAASLEQEIAGSRRMLEQHLDRRVDLFSYPNGANNMAVVDMVRRHYRAAVTTEKSFAAASSDLVLLPRIPGGGSRATFTRRLHRPRA